MASSSGSLAGAGRSRTTTGGAMNPIAAKGSDNPIRFQYRRMGRTALGRGTPLGREVGKRRSERESGVTQADVYRGLTWRPALSGIGFGGLQIEPRPNPFSLGSGREHRTYLCNAGGSPAIGARYVYRRTEPGWFVSTPVDVPARGAEEVVRGQCIDVKVAGALLGSIGATETLAGAILCRDFLNRRWCFPISDVENTATLEPIVWREGSHAPGWASSPELWAP
jgi:hypothetical protein